MNDSADMAAVRRLVARKYELPIPAALRFLTAETVEGLDRQAAALARPLDEHREQEEAEAPAGPFGAMATARARRKRELVDALCGRQPRDYQGRFAAGFDGGARESVPLPPPTHEETLAKLLATRAADSVFAPVELDAEPDVEGGAASLIRQVDALQLLN
jgi:hypothetical protein